MDTFEIIQSRIDNISKGPAKMPLIIGISGGQGSGKSYVSRQLRDHYEYDCAILSLDDFYLTKSERQKLSNEVSPLLMTRGVPGTHDIDLFLKALDDLRSSQTTYPLNLPLFNKLADDRDRNHHNVITKSPSIIAIEGWCVGAIADPDFIQSKAINAVEEQDRDKAWRRYQYDCLSGAYQDLWAKIDYFFYLMPPDFAMIKQWRTEQLANDKNIPLDDLPQSDRDWVGNFIQYYERITRCIMNGNHHEGTVLKLNKDRAVTNVTESSF
jgi:D-glycerate 3-kinase